MTDSSAFIPRFPSENQACYLLADIDLTFQRYRPALFCQDMEKFNQQIIEKIIHFLITEVQRVRTILTINYLHQTFMLLIHSVFLLFVIYYVTNIISCMKMMITTRT